MTAVEQDGKEVVRNQYDDSNRIVRQILADGSVYRYDYQLKNGNISEATVTFPDGTSHVELQPRYGLG